MSDFVWMYNPTTGGYAQVPQQAFDETWAAKGWVLQDPGEIDTWSEATAGGKGDLAFRRFVGRNTVPGPPTSGTFQPDDEIIDSVGQIWRCTVAGTPGTWAAQGVGSATSVTLSPKQIPAAVDSLELQKQSNVFAPKIVTLIAGQEDEASPTCTSCTASSDLTNFKIGIQGWKLSTSGAVTPTARWDPVFGTIGNDPVVMTQPPAAIGMWVFIEDVTKLTGSLELDLYSDTGATHVWTATKAVSALVTGWNLIRFHAGTGTLILAEWGTLYRLRIVFQTTAATSITIGHIWAECHTKARVLLVADGPYGNAFYTQGAYASMKARNIPVTFAVDPGLLGSNTGVNQYMTEAQLLAAMADGNGNSIGGHNWDSTLNSGMTAAQIRANEMQIRKWMECRGFHPYWRPAWLQNSAPNASGADSLTLAYASPTGASGLGTWPPIDPRNIPRKAIHSLTQAQMDTDFAQLAVTHQFVVYYMHGVDDTNSTWVTQANWDYFLSKVDTALAAGGLEFVTFEQLVTRSGLKHKQTLGDWVTEYYDASGVRQTVRLP